MDLDKYKGVIRRVYDKYSGQPFEAFFTGLVTSMEIAQDLMGETGAVSPVSLVTQSVSIKTSPRMPISLSVNAPPPVADSADDDAPDDDADYYESRPGKGDGANKLQAKLQQILPLSITVDVPGILEPLTLVRGVGSPGNRFVHVSYTLPGDQQGPRCTIMTSQRDIDPVAIIRDMEVQAKATYSKEKRVIHPHAAPPPPPPTAQDLQAMLDRDRRAQPNTPLTHEDHELAKEWEQSRSASPRWQ